MKKAIFYVLSLFVVVGGISVSEASSQGVLREVLSRMDKHHKALQTLQAKVERSKLNPQLGTTDDYEGNLALIPGKGREFSMRLDWTKPSAEHLSVINGSYVMFIPRTNIAYYGSADSNKPKEGTGPLTALNMSEAQLRQNYKPTLVSDAAKLKDGTVTFHINLQPLTKQSFKNAELWVDADGMPRQIKVTAANNDTDTFFLSNIKKNGTVNKKDLQVATGNAKRIQS